MTGKVLYPEKCSRGRCDCQPYALIESNTDPTEPSFFEALSDKVRMGIPVGFSEALEVIEYQEKLRAEKEDRRNRTIVRRFVRWIRGA